MNKLYIAISASLILAASTAFAKHTNCFNPYQVRIVNQSGGEAELLRSSNISGFRRGLKNAIPNWKSQDIVVEDLGASLTIEHGPEDKEKTDRITFYEKNGPIPTIVLKGTSIEARGFNQQKGQQYNVAIRNESGGKAKIVSACHTTIRGDIDNGTSRDARVSSGSTITLQMGPKGNKKMYLIRFSTPVEGGKPTIILQQTGWFRPAITGKDVRFGAARTGYEKQPVNLGPKKMGKKIKYGACGQSRHVTRPDDPTFAAKG